MIKKLMEKYMSNLYVNNLASILCSSVNGESGLECDSPKAFYVCARMFALAKIGTPLAKLECEAILVCGSNIIRSNVQSDKII